MTAEIVNLRRARKAKARGEREKQAELNRARFGQTKAERVQERAEAMLAGKRLDAHKRETPDKEE